MDWRTMASYRIFQEVLSGQATRFVVVDDNEELLQIWRRVLALEENCICFLTTNPQEALREIQTEEVDILITDISMPEMNGIILARKAKKLLPKLQIFFTTGDVSNFYKIEPWDEEPEVLQKPYADIQHVQSFIHDLATHHPLDRQYCTDEGKLHVWHL
jgi:CheY-like chemotaxis protein